MGVLALSMEGKIREGLPEQVFHCVVMNKGVIKINDFELRAIVYNKLILYILTI